MFFTLSKILSFLISPIVWILGLIIIAIFIRMRTILIVAVCLFFFFSNSFILNEVMLLWEVPVTKISDLRQTYDCGIVLGGGIATYDDKYDRITFRQNTDRILQAVYLYKIGKIKKIFISSGSGDIVYRNMLESTLIRKYLLSIGIPDNVILVDSLSDNTRQNAIYSSRILKKNFPNGKFLMITSALHMRRALACFEKEEILADSYSTTKYSSGKRIYHFTHLLIPKMECLILWDKLIHEIFGYIIYAVTGYL